MPVVVKALEMEDGWSRVVLLIGKQSDQIEMEKVKIFASLGLNLFGLNSITVAFLLRVQHAIERHRLPTLD
jgi:hypothetical protein